MDVFILIVTIVGSVLSLLVDLYLLIIYMHRQQQKTRPISIFCMIVVIFTLLQVQLQPLFLLFDAISSRTGGADLTYLWAVIYFSILANLALLKPLASSLYESDEEDSCITRVCWTLVEVLITAACFGIFLGIGWLFWGKFYLPVEQIVVSSESQGTSDLTQNVFQSEIEIEVTVPCFLVGMLCLIGYPILACCGACGLSALPFSMFVEFRNRPKWRRTNEARAISEQLKKETVRLIKQADQLRRSVNRAQFIDGWFAKRKKNQQIQSQVTEMENKLSKHRDFYDLFKLELDMQNTNPWFFIFKLIGGIICIIVTPLWLVQILLSQLVFQESVFLDKFFVLMENEGAGFLSTAFILLLTFYMIVATLKGIFFVSQYLPFLKIHPMQEGKTWLNSFMFQATMAVLAATSIVHLLVNTFPEYLRGGDITLVMGIICQRMLFIGVLIYHRVFIYILLIMSVLGTIFSAYTLFCRQAKSESQLKIEEIRMKLFGKNNKNRELAYQMTEMNLHGKSKKDIKSENQAKTDEKIDSLKKTDERKDSSKKKKKHKVRLVLQ